MQIQKCYKWSLFVCTLFIMTVIFFPLVSFCTSSEFGSNSNHQSANYGISGTMNNIPLFYLSEGQITPDNIKPLVAYIDFNGSAKDWNYDGVLFCDYRLNIANKPGQAACDEFTYDLFEHGGLETLDKTVGTLKHQLHSPSYKFNVIIQIPYWANAANAKENIFKILDKWNNSDYKNLTLAGFYWGYTEEPRTKDYDIREIAYFIHGLGLGLKVLAIPYYDQWNRLSYHRLGVDYVMGGPNYTWAGHGNISAFRVVNEAIQSGVLDGVEFELAENYLKLSREGNANIYINEGILYGWRKNAINSYYYAPGVLEKLTAISDRRIYDRIYQSFILSNRDSVH